MRNPEIPGREISAKAIPTRGTFLDPVTSSFRTHTSYRATTRCSTSYRATTRYPEIPANGPRIVVRGDSRTGPRHLVIPRCDAVLHVIPRYDAESRKYPLGHSALDAESRNTRAGNTGKGNTHKRHFSGPRIVVRGDPVRRGIQEYPPRHSALDAESRNTRAVIPHLMRNPEIPANGPRIAVRGDPV